MKLLMTGATGFIGSRVLEKIISLYGADSVAALSSGTVPGVRTIPANGYSFGMDYLENNGCRDVDTVLHLGAFIPKSAADANNAERTDENIANTRALLAASLPELKHFVYISTADVYSASAGTITEESPTEPETLYGLSKLKCEELVSRHCTEKNIDCTILRLGHVYGEGEEKYKKVMPVMIKNAINGKNLCIYGTGQAGRTYIYIDDAVSAIVNALSLNGQCVINIAGDEVITVAQLAEKIARLAENRVHIEYVSSQATERSYIYDNSKMKAMLLRGLTPFDEGLRREYEHMKNI